MKKSVRVLLRPGTPVGTFDEWLPDNERSNLEVVEASFSDVAALRRITDNVSVIFHVAASTRGSVASQVANTVVGSDNLYHAAVEGNVPRLVLVSSLGVMDASHVPRRGIIDESVPMDSHPEWRDPYSFAKQRQEALAWKHHRDSRLGLVVLRPGPIVGPGQLILGSRIGLWLPGMFMHLGGGTTVPLTYVQNCADAVVQAGFVPNIDGEAFCVVDDSLPTSRALLRRYRREVARIPFVTVPYFLLHRLAQLNEWYYKRTGGHLPAVFTPYKVESMWKGHRYSNQKAKRLLHWMPRVPMAQALDVTFAHQPRPL
jgi:nucleoside-diphosphate-sugar epimerase